MDKYELTFPQKNIWMVENFYESQLINIISGSFCINENFDMRLAEQMVNKFVELNEGMRLRIELIGGIPKQYVVPFVPFHADKKNIQNASYEEIEEFKDQYIARPINLIGSPLFSYLLLDKGNGVGEVFVKLHHIIGDAWTISKMGTAFSNIYEALLKNEEYNETCPGYTDFILAEQDYLNSEKFVKDNEFWNEYLRMADSPLGLKDSGIIKDTKAKRYSVVLGDNYQQMLDEYCKENKVSPYTVFLSALAIYMQRIMAKDDFIIGTPVLNRSNFKEKNMSGMFISTMPVRFKIDENETFLELVKRVGIESLTLFRHQKYPYLKIAEAYKNETSVTDNMYKLMLSYQNARASVAVPGKYELRWRFSGHIQDELELHISDLNDTGRLEIHFDYLTSLFEGLEVEYLAKRILAIIKDGIKNNSSIETIKIMSDEEKDKIINEFNDTSRPYPKEKTVIELFEEQVKQNPNKTALLFEETKMSYGELNSRANMLAGLLIDKGVKENDAVAVIVDKSYELLISLLAVSKVGAYYLPIEINFAHEKKEYMINDASVKVVIEDHIEGFENVDEINVTEIDFSSLEERTVTRSASYGPESPVCILYTSGTTGNPKGALITNKNIVKLVKNPDYMELKSTDTIIQAASTSFDVSLFEFWGSLLNGGTCALITKANLLDFEYLNSYIKRKRVSIAWITSALFNQIIDGKIEVFESLHTVLSGGDVMSLKHVNKLRSVYPHLTIINCYGPTECVTFTNTYKVEKVETRRVPLGKAISNTYGYVVDKKFRLLPLYTEGEYVIGGDSVALMYINKPKLTKEKFVSDAITNKGRMYKTGDVVRMLDKGYIDFVGRRDNQVKIRGYRIELDEITNRVLKLDNVEDAVTVIAEKNGIKHINLYYVGINDITDEEVIRYLKEKLPVYMIPTGIMKLDKMPLNQNGKVDRKNLPVILVKHRQEKMNKTEKVIFDIIKEELQIEPTLDDNLFDVGLDSLSVIRVVTCISGKINTNITTRDVMKLATIHDIAEYILNENKELGEDVTENKDININILSAQNSIFMEYMKDTETTLYNIPFELTLENNIDIERLTESLKQVINNHQTFFTKFVVVNSKITEKVEVRDFKIDVRNVTKEEYDNIKSKFVKPFDLLEDMLFRIKVYIVEDKVNILFDFHHSIFDGYSLQLFLNELSSAYSKEGLAKEKSTYLDYVKEYNVLDEDVEFFKDMFKEEVQVTDMPYDRPRTKYLDGEGNKVKIDISDELYLKIKEYIVKNNFTVNSLMQSVYAITLSKYTYSNDVTIGISDANRVSAKYMNTVGMFVKTLPYRETIDWNKQIVEYIKDTQKKIIDIYSHNTCNYEELLKHIKLNRMPNRTPLFDTLFVCQNKVENIEIGNNEAYITEIKRNNSKFDITFEVVPSSNMYITVEYRTSLYNEDTIRRFVSNYLNVLNYVLDNENSTLYEIEMISKEERNIVLNRFNNTKTDYPSDKAIHTLFEETVEKFKEKKAIVFEDKSFTYEELNKRANRLARYLLTKDVKKGESIGIMIDKSIEYMVAVLGVLKAGLSYMPIAMDIPEERLKYLISNANVTEVITTNEFDRKIQNVSKIYIDYIEEKNDYQHITDDTNIELKIAGDDKAYVLYTSGTTGVPKGILVPHKGITRLLLNTNLVDYTDKEIMLVSGSTTFDTSGFEIWGAMFYGMTLHLMRKKNILTPKYYGEYLEQNQITTTLIPTPIFNQLVEYNVKMFEHLNTLYVGGDVLQPKYSNLIIRNCPNTKLINIYGPTENSVISSSYVVEKEFDNDISIGVPISNSTCYVIDKCEKLCPIGVPGDLYVGGDGLAFGYVNNQKLTDDKFVLHLGLNERVYKTGDLTLFYPDGNIKFMGRIDTQIKLRGQRIEISEIQNRILSYEGIKECIVLLKGDDSNKFLAAYYVGENIAENEMIEFLKKHLPTYMVPAKFVKLKKMPLNQNGKIDRAALPDVKVKETKKVYPLTRFEEKVLNAFKEVLGNENLGMIDDFFENGGDSLSAMSLVGTMESKGIAITYADVFNYPTAKSMCEFLNWYVKRTSGINSIKNYDYTKINKLLLENNRTVNNDKKITNVLLTGATGFLGVHILKELLENKDIEKIYCIVRDKNGKLAENRLIDNLHYYFENTYDRILKERVVIVEGNATHLELINSKLLQEMRENVDIVINSAAYVKHFGKEEIFEEVNITGVNKLIEFCKKTNKKLIQISTISVSGNIIESGRTLISKVKEGTIFDETKLYIGQDIENVYVLSKFIAERNILESVINDNLDAMIIRVGNLMGRYNDGVFQKNISENAFVNRIKTFANLGMIPENLKDISLEFTPVDYTAKAVVKLLKDDNIVYHVYNKNHASVELVKEVLTDMGYSIIYVTKQDMTETIKEIMKNSAKNNSISGIVQDLDKNKEIDYASNIKVGSDETVKKLQEYNFTWPEIDKTYIETFLSYLKDKDFFKGE